MRREEIYFLYGNDSKEIFRKIYGYESVDNAALLQI